MSKLSFLQNNFETVFEFLPHILKVKKRQTMFITLEATLSY